MSKQLQKNRLYVPGIGTIEKENWTDEHYDQFMKTLPAEWPKQRAIAKFFTPKAESIGQSIQKDAPAKSEKKNANTDERKLAAAEYLTVTGKRAGSQWDVAGIREKQKEWEAENPKGTE